MRTSSGHRILKLLSVVLLACLLACTTFPVYAEWDEGYDEEEPWRYDYFLTEQDRLYNSLPHPYLAGYYSEDGSEITITGTKCLRRSAGIDSAQLIPTYLSVEGTLVIPDEINGIPVTEVAAYAFANNSEQIKYENKRAAETILVGKNVRKIGTGAFWEKEGGAPHSYMVVFGNNITDFDVYSVRGCLVCLYQDSVVHRLLAPFYPTYAFFYDWVFIDESHLISDKVKIDEALNVYLPWGVTKETLGDYVSVDGDARINVLGDTIENGTQIELVNSTYGTIDNTYTVVLEKPQITVTAKPQRTAFAKTTFSLDAKVTTTGEPCKLTFASDNPDVAAVDENGVVTTDEPGTAHITVTAADKYGFSENAVCTVTVQYSWWQWLIRIFLFGWLWY